MGIELKGLHHVTSLAADAASNNAFFTTTLGLRRVKKTVNFDAPDVYHLYYGDETGTPGTVMTYFPFPGARRGRRGVGEAGTVAFAVPKGAIGYWAGRLAAVGVSHRPADERFGEARLAFDGPDGDSLVLIETDGEARAPWTGSDVPAEAAIRGFHSVTLDLDDAAATRELLQLMGYEEAGRDGAISRFALAEGNGADIVDIETDPGAKRALQGAGSVHHVAFAVADRAAQLEAHRVLSQAGHALTPVIDRDYFYSVYFRSPGGVLFEIATAEPGFERDEDRAHLGEALKLPVQHAHLRSHLETQLPPIDA